MEETLNLCNFFLGPQHLTSLFTVQPLSSMTPSSWLPLGNCWFTIFDTSWLSCHFASCSLCLWIYPSVTCILHLIAFQPYVDFSPQRQGYLLSLTASSAVLCFCVCWLLWMMLVIKATFYLHGEWNFSESFIFEIWIAWLVILDCVTGINPVFWKSRPLFSRWGESEPDNWSTCSRSFRVETWLGTQTQRLHSFSCEVLFPW